LGLILIPAAFMVSENRVAVGAILVAIALIFTAAVIELRGLSVFNSCLDAVAWLIAGLTLSAVVARAAFASGRVTYHRIIGGVLLYLTIGLTSVALFGFGRKGGN
jgi:hypothetical protein